MGSRPGNMTGRRNLLIGLITSALAPVAIAQEAVSQASQVPNHVKSLPNTLQHSDSGLQMNLLHRRQYSCPNPSTDEFCDSNSCFLVQNNADGTWGTCCLAGSSLILYGGGEDYWSSQKCCPSGSSIEQCEDGDISTPPMQPLECGTGGIISGWACVYGSGSTSASNTGYRVRQSLALVAITGVIWLVKWH